MKGINAMAIPGIRRITIEELAAEIWGIEKELLYTKTRKIEVVEARHVLMTFRKEHMGHSFEKAAKPYNKDHATAMNSVQKVQEFNETDKVFAEKYTRFLNAAQRLKLHQ